MSESMSCSGLSTRRGGTGKEFATEFQQAKVLKKLLKNIEKLLKNTEIMP